MLSHFDAVSRNISIEETEALVSDREHIPSLFVGNVCKRYLNVLTKLIN